MLDHTMASICTNEPALPVIPASNLRVLPHRNLLTCRDDHVGSVILPQMFGSQQLCLPVPALVQLEAQPVLYIFQIGADTARRTHSLEYTVERDFHNLALFLLIGQRVIICVARILYSSIAGAHAQRLEDTCSDKFLPALAGHLLDQIACQRIHQIVILVARTKISTGLKVR